MHACSEWKLQVKNYVPLRFYDAVKVMYSQKSSEHKRMREQCITLKRCFYINIRLSARHSDKPKKMFSNLFAFQLRCRSASSLVFMWISLYDTRVFPLPFAHSKSLIVSCQWQLVTWHIVGVQYSHRWLSSWQCHAWQNKIPSRHYYILIDESPSPWGLDMLFFNFRSPGVSYIVHLLAILLLMLVGKSVISAQYTNTICQWQFS